MFKFITIFLISSLIIINFVNSKNLFSITPGNNNDINVLLVTTYASTTLLNKTLTLPSDNLVVQAVPNYNYTTGLMTLFCLSKNDQKQYLIELDILSGEFTILNGISNGNYNFNNGNSYQNYLYGYHSKERQHIYLPANVEDKEGLSIVNWNFEQSLTDQEVNLFSVLNTLDIDTTITPFGALDYNNNLIVAYHSLKSESNVATILYLDLNSTFDNSNSGSGSDDGIINLLPYETHQIQIYLHDVSSIDFLYTDYVGNVYIVSNGTSVCQIDFVGKTCFSIYDILINYDNHASFLLSQDKQSVITISNQQTQPQQDLTVGIWTFNFQGGESYEINNYWNNTNIFSFFVF